MRKENRRGIAACLQLAAPAVKGFPSAVASTPSHCTGLNGLFRVCVDRRKRLGGAESRSVGDSASNPVGSVA